MIISFFGTVETGLFGLFLFLFSDVVNVVSDNALWVAILKQEFAKVIKGRFKQESRGANSVTAISKCTKRQVITSSYYVKFNMFITAICVLFLVKLRWPKNKKLYQDGNIVLCFGVRDLTCTVPLLTQVYRWILANLTLGVTLWWISIPFRGGGRRILLVASCYRKQDKLCMVRGSTWLACRLHLLYLYTLGGLKIHCCQNHAQKFTMNVWFTYSKLCHIHTLLLWVDAVAQRQTSTRKIICLSFGLTSCIYQG